MRRAILSAALLPLGAPFLGACEEEKHDEIQRPVPEMAATRAKKEKPKAGSVTAPERLVPKGLQPAMDHDLHLSGKIDKVKMSLTSPEPGDVVVGDTLEVEVELSGYDTKPGSRHVHVIVDNLPYQAYYKAGQEPFEIDLEELELEPGAHTLRAFPSRPWHESIKSSAAFAATHFYYKEKKGDPPKLDGPLLTYSRPKGTYEVGPRENRILLDFFVSGVELQRGGYTVRYTLDSRSPVELPSWAPVWLEDLSEREHRIKLQLLDGSGKPVDHPYNTTSRTFDVELKEK